MKKTLNILVLILLVCCVTACGNTNESNSNNSGNTNESNSNNINNVQTIDNSQSEMNDLVHDYFKAGYSSATGAYATISLKAELGLKDDAWVGLCPKGKEYKTEIEADAVDIIWFSPDSRETADDDFVFACDFSDVEDGTYAFVVAVSDSEEDSKIVIQLEMTKSGDSISFDYSNAKLNK